jgi:hypothetical protein
LRRGRSYSGIISPAQGLRFVNHLPIPMQISAGSNCSLQKNPKETNNIRSRKNGCPPALTMQCLRRCHKRSGLSRQPLAHVSLGSKNRTILGSLPLGRLFIATGGLFVFVGDTFAHLAEILNMATRQAVP